GRFRAADALAIRDDRQLCAAGKFHVVAKFFGGEGFRRERLVRDDDDRLRLAFFHQRERRSGEREQEGAEKRNGSEHEGRGGETHGTAQVTGKTLRRGRPIG